jgi:malate synthase
MSQTSLSTPVVIALVSTTAVLATGLGYLWANSKKELSTPATQQVAQPVQPATPYVYMPSFDAPALIKLAPDVFAELERRCQTKQHTTCDALKSEAVQKARQMQNESTKAAK